MGRIPALLCLWCACTVSARPVTRPGRVLAPLPEREHHRAKQEPLHISAAAQHNLSESYRRYIKLKRTPPAKLLQDARTKLQDSVADLTEQQLPRETIVEYLSHSVGLKRAWASAKYSKATGDLVFQSLRKQPSEKLWKQRAGGWELPERTEEQQPAAPAADKAPDNDVQWKPDKAPWKPAEKKPWEQRAEANKKRWEWNKAHPNKQKIRDVEGTDMVSLRCGQSWDDAAVKCGEACNGFCPEGVCYKDLPECDQMFPAGKCYGAHEGVSDSWCTMAAVTSSKRDDYGPFVVASEFHANCICDDDAIGINDFVEPVPNYSQNASGLPWRNDQLIEAVAENGRQYPGLPSCTWNPPAAAKCNNESAYECMSGAKAGQCSADNWYDKPSECSTSCVHTALLNWVPYSAVWRAGPRAKVWQSDEQLPHYIARDTAAAAFAAQKKVFENPLRVMMSTYCRSKQIRFVGVSLFSPHYESKAARLVESCNRLGVCCKATEMRADALGADAEGSDAFRYRMIALKPLFILDQLEKTKEPVVYLDVDLEFHKFPKLFLPGSWPDGPRDVALFNFHSNASNLTMRMSDQAVGSAVAYFNQTYRAKKMLTAWAEAMMYGTNGRAPDDQVLDTLLNYGGWMARCSLGWLPAAYLRLMPAFYRGVETVIDHDHGSQPGIKGHSQLKPQLPDVVWREPVTELEITKSQGDGDGYTGPTEAAIESDQRERVKKAKMRGEDVGSEDEAILPTPGGKIICKTLMPDRVTDEWCTLNCATSARRDPSEVANEDLEEDCPPEYCACPEDLLDAVDKAESDAQRKVDEKAREEEEASAKVAAEEKKAWQQEQASEDKERDPNAPWDGHGNPPGDSDWGAAPKEEEAPQKAVAGAVCTSMKSDLADDEWCDQSCLLEGGHVSTDDGCDPEYCTCPWEQAPKREQEKVDPAQHPERSIQIGGPDAGSPTTTSTGAPSAAAKEDQAGRAAEAKKEAEAAAAAELEAEAKAMDDRRAAGVEAAKAEAARAEAEARRAEAEAARAEAAHAESDAEAAESHAAEVDKVQEVSEDAARAAAAAQEDAQAAQSDTQAKGWAETMTPEEKAAADAADAEAVAGAKNGGASGAAEEVRSPEEEAAAVMAEADAIANAEAAMAKEDDADATAAAAAAVADATAAADADLPGKDCTSLQPERVSDMWCKENCGLSKWNGPVGSDACDREFCKCPGDEDRKQQGAESAEAHCRQNADGSCIVDPPSEDDGGWNPGPPPSVDPGPNNNGAPEPVPGVGAGSTQQSPELQIGGPDAGYPVGEHAPEVPADRRSTQEAPTPTGCCGGNGMSSCWGCGNDGKGWCHSGQDACDPKCNGTWMETIAPPVCRGAIDAHGPGGDSASSSSSSSSASSSSASADASYEERLRIQRNSVQRNGVDAAVDAVNGVYDAAASSTINPSTANPSSANPSSANDWALEQPNAASLSRSAVDSESGVQSVKGDDERAQRDASKAEREESKAEGKMEHDNQVAINEAEKLRQRESAEAAHKEAKEARVAADTKRRDLHNELKAQRQGTDGANVTAAVSTALPSAVEMARREAEAALDAARAESEAAHRAAEAHRKEFEERLDKRKAQREAEAAEARRVTSFRALRAAPITASRVVAAAPAAAAHAAAAPAAAASGVNSYGETVPSPEALRALLAKAKAAKAKPS